MILPLIAVTLQAAPLVCPPQRPYDPANPFARILRGEAPASRIAETADMIAIVPIDWTHPGHALVIPRRAVRTLDDMTAEEMVHALELARRVAAAQRLVFGATGYSIQQNNGRAQHVCHVHFHVIPNTPAAPAGAKTKEQMDTIATALRGAMAAAAQASGTP
ncbi:histidine triad (HIT) family protein [Sphingomonas guangdongensis]|uniref:Histidine triad (HIT) family protein n=1 Tax=Sphingomonas guangdongensis TaxID=1141890 RepID=A0A285QYN8_9SPHN|nr:HIT domain-containing protein [Sphingomonas guangdongensis]SOB87043.1 histidine triad (HIT) family protein [Sphingomonas guangdongensis]